jgi:2-amino-4-hydroxy-6-hydroxymethyldihydropteridine diphosphokinase
MTNCCYLALGSNLRSPNRQLRLALSAVRNIPRTIITKQSTIYKTRPLGARGQPQYSNMVIEIRTCMTAKRLLRYTQAIEHQQKRVRKKRWGARTLDIDILLFNNTSICTHDLIVPHPQMLLRDFVLIPLLEIAPTTRLPDGELIQPYFDICQFSV